VKVTFFQCKRDNVVRASTTFDLTLAQLYAEWFSEHLVTPDKDSIGFMLAEFKLGADGTCGREGRNVVAYHGVVLDIDNGWALEDALADLHGFAHLGYTTFSHQLNGKDKFRIVLPFAEACPVQEWELRKDDLLNVFPQVDPASAKIGQFFYVPACPPHMAGLAERWLTDGATFDWRLLARKDPPKPRPFLAPEERAKLVRTGGGKVRWETFDVVRFAQDHGFYIKRAGATKHFIECPNSHEHSSVSPTATVLFENLGERVGFHCAHAHCAQFKFYDWAYATYGKDVIAAYCLREESKYEAFIAAHPQQRKATGHAS